MNAPGSGCSGTGAFEALLFGWPTRPLVSNQDADTPSAQSAVSGTRRSYFCQAKVASLRPVDLATRLSVTFSDEKRPSKRCPSCETIVRCNDPALTSFQ